MKRAVYILLIAATFAGCRDLPVPEFPAATELPNVNIDGLRSYYPAGATDVVISPDIVFAGRVVSSDRAGNFYNTFLIDDGTGAVEIMAGMTDLHATYHPGQRVVVRARGLAIGWRDGVMQIGLPPEPGNRYATGYFYHPAVMRAYVSAEHDVEPIAPIETTLGELHPDMCGRLVRIAELTVDEEMLADAGSYTVRTSTVFPTIENSADESHSSMGSSIAKNPLALELPNAALPSALTWATTQPAPATGYVKFRAASTPAIPAVTAVTAGFTTPPADSITVVTSGYASFASMPVPREPLTLTGILFYGKGGGSKDHYLLKLRDEKDIAY